MPKPVCIVDGCDQPGRARGRCNTHYHVWRRANLNAAADPHDDPRMGFAKRFTDLLNEAPDGLLTAADRELITAVVFTAAAAARGVLPLTPTMRRDMLHAAVDALGANEAVAE